MRGVKMNIKSANYMSGAGSAVQGNRSNQDSHEKNIQNQITSLQGKMRDLSYDTEMSADEKSDEKKKLKEQIQSLNSELKQYQIKKRREEAEKKQTDTEKSDENAKTSSSDIQSADKTTAASAADADENANTAVGAGTYNNKDTENTGSQAQPDKQELGMGGAETEMMFSLSNTKKQFANMEKIQTNLTGLMRTAETDEEKLKLQKKIDNIANIIENKAQKTADNLTKVREEEQAKKEKIREMQKEQEARKANMKAAVPKSGKSLLGDKEYGKVLITRKKS